MSLPVRAIVRASWSLVLSVPATAALAGAADTTAAGQPPMVPLYVEEAGTGVDHSYDGSWQFFTGGGVAVLDCDDDELPDLYFAGGSEPAGLYRNLSALGGPLAFERLESATTDLTAVTGAYPIDIDSDGLTDLAVLRARGERAPARTRWLRIRARQRGLDLRGRGRLEHRLLGHVAERRGFPHAGGG